MACLAGLAAAPFARADGDEAFQWLRSGDCKRAGDAINEGLARNEAKAFAVAGFMVASTGCVEPDMPRAAHFYRRAVELGDREARVPLGLMYGLGEGVPQDFREAHHWFTFGNQQATQLDPSEEIERGYARTVTELAHGRVTYPPHDRDREGTVYVTFDAATGAVSFAAAARDGSRSKALFRSTPFTDAIAEAYAEAYRLVPKFAGIADRERLYEAPWTFQLK